jgi:hypothetical protein
MSTLLSLKNITQEDLFSVGEKAVKLGMLYKRFPVPNGFVISKDVFETFLEQTGLKTMVSDYLGNVDPSRKEKLQSLANKIQKEIVQAEFPQTLFDDIKEHYYALHISPGDSVQDALHDDEGPFVSVRNSPVGYVDLAKHHMSFLNIRGEERLKKAILTSWASFFTTNAILHRQHNNINDSSMAVVIQVMLNPSQSGIVYSTNPTNHDEALILACRGLGTAIVNGTVIPDRYKIRKENLTVEHVDIKKQSLLFQRDMDTHRTTKVELGEELGMKQKLHEGQMRDLTLLAKRIEKYFDHPQQIEFAVEKDQYYILQAQNLSGFEDYHPPELVENEEKEQQTVVTGMDENEKKEGGFSMVINASDNDKKAVNDVLSKLNMALPGEKEQQTADETQQPETPAEESSPEAPSENLNDAIASLHEESEAVEKEIKEEESHEEVQAESQEGSPIISIEHPEGSEEGTKEEEPAQEETSSTPEESFELPADEASSSTEENAPMESLGTPLHEETSTEKESSPVGFFEEEASEPAAVETPSEEESPVVEEESGEDALRDVAEGVQSVDEEEPSAEKAVEEAEVNSVSVPEGATETQIHFDTVQHAASHLVLSCYMTINQMLKQKYKDVKGFEPNLPFSEMVNELRAETTIPHVDDIMKINSLRHAFVEELNHPTSEEVKEALDVCHRFMKDL